MKNRLNPTIFLIAFVFAFVVWLITNSAITSVLFFLIALVPSFSKVYLEYVNDNPKKLWFKRKLYGWGWTPANWNGWFVTIIYLALIFGFALLVDQHSTLKEVAFTFLLPLVLLTIVFTRIAYLKGEKPKWQWGVEKKRG